MANTCPECGIDFDAQNVSAAAHAHEHWGGLPDAAISKEAKERRDAVLKIAEGQSK